MFLDFYQHLPLKIDPIAFSIGSFAIRWYSISYLIGFFVTYFVLFKAIKNSELKKDAQIFNFKFLILNKNFKFQISNLVIDFLLLNFFAALIGGRIGYVVLYDFSYFSSHPLSIISPFVEGRFVGFYGMSYHGALLAIILASYFFAKYKKINFWRWADLTVSAAALGYFFGRIGNFLNGELYGRITDSKLGMYFLADPYNLRHPSQLYEAFGEGLLLFLVLWQARKSNLPSGVLFCLYLILYGVFRIVAEFFREPDLQIGFVFAGYTLGQLLSFFMILAGVILMWIRRKKVIQ